MATTTRDRDRRILGLALPALGGLAVEPLYVLVDTAIVGRLGTVPLGGLALASTVLTSLLWVFNFLAYGTTARVAFLLGRGDEREAGSVAVQGLWISAFASVPVTLLIALGAHRLASILGGERAVLDAAATYLHWSAPGVPAVLIILVGQGYLRGRSDTRTPFMVLLASNATNVVLELVLVYGFHLGLAGSAVGTVIAQWGAALWFLALLRPHLAAAGVPTRADRAEILRLVTIGRALFVRTAFLLATLAVSTSVASRTDPTTLGGHQIALQIETFLALAVDALAIPAQALVGTSLGAGDLVEARVMSRRLLRWGLGAGVVLAAVVAVAAPLLPHLFSGDPDVTGTATVALLVVALMQLPASVTFVLDGVLMGASDFRFLQWAVAGASLTFLPFAVAVLAWPRLGIGGIWAGLATWMVVRALANLRRFGGDDWMAVAAA